MPEFRPDFSHEEPAANLPEDFVKLTHMKMGTGRQEGSTADTIGMLFEAMGCPVPLLYQFKDKADTKRFIEALMAAYKVLWPDN